MQDRLDAAITVAVGPFDGAGRWQVEGATSMTAWLRHHVGMTRADAARLRATARRLRTLPVTSP